MYVYEQFHIVFLLYCSVSNKLLSECKYKVSLLAKKQTKILFIYSILVENIWLYGQKFVTPTDFPKKVATKLEAHSCMTFYAVALQSHHWNEHTHKCSSMTIPLAQSELHEDIACQGYSGRTQVVCKKPWPQPHWTTFGWTGTPDCTRYLLWDLNSRCRKCCQQCSSGSHVISWVQ